MQDFIINIQDLQAVPNAAIVTVSGSIDFYTVGGFRKEIESAQAQGVKKFIIDMDGVSYINSTGISIIINLAGAGGTEAPALVLLKVPPRIRAIFDLLKLGPLLKFFETLEEAIHALQGSGAAH